MLLLAEQTQERFHVIKTARLVAVSTKIIQNQTARFTWKIKNCIDSTSVAMRNLSGNLPKGDVPNSDLTTSSCSKRHTMKRSRAKYGARYGFVVDAWASSSIKWTFFKIICVISSTILNRKNQKLEHNSFETIKDFFLTFVSFRNFFWLIPNLILLNFSIKTNRRD